MDAVDKRGILTRHRVVLLLAVKRGMALTRPPDHQLVQRAQSGPAHHRPLVHLGLMLLIERHRRGFALLRGVGVEQIALELLPQIHALRPVNDGLEHLAIPERVFQKTRQHRVVMQHRADQNGIHAVVWWPQVQHRGRHELLQFVPLCRGGDVLVVLDVVHDRQVWAVRPVATTTNLFRRTKRLHLAPVGCHNHTRTPHPPLSTGFGEIAL